MWLLQLNDDHELSLVERGEEDIPRYAILSHAWEADDNEYTFQDAMEGKSKDKPGYQKVRFCVEQAARDRLAFCWIDTCCIDRSNRTELQHATESMFRWYQNAEKCYVYLSDVSRNPLDEQLFGLAESKSDLRNSSWFSYALSRPYLLASVSIEFFSREGMYLGNKTSMARILEEMRDVPGNTTTLDEKIPPQLNIFEQLGSTLPSKRTYEEEGSPYVPGMPNVPMHAYAIERAKIPRQRFSEPYISSLSKQQKQAWMDSLRVGPMDARQRTVENAHSNACEWLLYTPEYSKWLDITPANEKQWILCIKGSPGTGKSTLMKFLFNHVQKWQKRIKAVSFFFGSGSSYRESPIAGAYRSLSVQLLEGNLALQEVFDTLNISMPNGEPGSQWTIEALERLLKETVRRSGPILCFIDAVNECPEEQARDMIKFFENIHTVAESYGTKFQVCFSTRNLSKISFNDGLEVVLEAQKGHTQAIANYIKDRLRIGNNELADRTRSQIQEMSSGVFLWVVLAVVVLNRELDQNGTDCLWRRLLEIPTNLHELFQALLLLKSDKDVEKLYFQLVLFAQRPLSPGELYFAIRGSDTKSMWDLETSMDIEEQFITEVSQGLMHVTKDESREIQYIHESVRQFLMDPPSLQFIRPDLNGNRHGQIHERLKQCCLDHIDIDIFSSLDIHKSRWETSPQEDRELLGRIRKAFPFMEYAVSNLLFHSNAAESCGVPQGRFLETFPLTKWVRLHNCFEMSRVRRYSANVSLLYILGECNMPELIKAYPSPFSGLEVEDERYGCPVFAAMAAGSQQALQAILEINGIDYSMELGQSEILMNFLFLKERTVLSYSAEFGFKGIVSALLRNDTIDVNTVDYFRQTPLMYAAQRGHGAVVKMLLGTGRADVTSKNRYRETSLMLASRGGHGSVVKMLLDFGKVDVNSKTYNGETSLMLAAREGHGLVVKMLLDTGRFDVTSKNRYGETSLMLASRGGHGSVVKMLLDFGKVDVNSKNYNGETSLMLASRGGHGSVVKMLLDFSKVDVNSKNYDGETSLMLAARGGYESVVQMLVGTHKLDADAALVVKDGKVPLAYKTRKVSLLSRRFSETFLSSRAMEIDLSTFEDDDDHETLSNAPAKQTNVTDETNVSIEQIGTRRLSILDSDDIGTASSDTSNLPDLERDINISHLAEDMSDQLFLENPDDHDILWVRLMLPEFLRIFALDIGQISKTQLHQNVMIFIDKNQESISQRFLEVSLERLHLSQDVASNSISAHPKISRWNRQRKRSKDEGLEDKLTLNKMFPEEQADPVKFQITTSTLTSQGWDETSKDGDKDTSIPTELSNSGFATRTPAYKILLERLRKELFPVPSQPKCMVAIRYGILGLLSARNAVGSGKTPAKAHTLRLVMDWNPLEFFKEQMYGEKPEEVVGKVITLTGSAEDAQAQTCFEYLSQIWPSAAENILLLLKNVLSSGPGHQHECKLLNGTQVTAWIQESQFMVQVSGTAYSIAEVGEQFVWISAALRSSPFESGVAYCTPFVFRNNNSYPKSEVTEHPVLSCTIQYALERGKEQIPAVNGRCWQHLFRNPVVVTGYPIRRRPRSNTGLDIPISLMMALCQARKITVFDGKPFIKGFCTMLVPTKHEEHVVTWHVLTNEDGSHISYTDPRAQNLPGDSLGSIGIFDVERCRHIIGWCASVRSYAGAAEADYDIGWSGLETPYDGDRLLRKTITSRKPNAASESFALGFKDIPSRNVGDQYIKRLMWIAGKFIVLFDVEDGRAWMFDGASSLLHLVRASLRFSQQDDFSDHFLFRSDNMEEAPRTKTGKAAAIWILTNETNKRIKLYESTECLKDRVEDLLHILEQIASYQDKAESSDLPPQQLEGFDFNAVAMADERIKPRITELPARGKGWVDFTKAIHAINLFGSGFGELIRPAENQTACSFWDKVPTGENHLAVCVSDIKIIQKREGSTKGGLLRLVDNIYWHKPDHIFEACLCAGEKAGRHSDRIQILIPRSNLEINDMALQDPGSLAPDGAVIFGHNSQNIERPNNLRRSRSTSTHQRANPTCYDSGIGSSLDSLSATPANSQFEAVSDTSATSTRKRSSSTSMAGRVYDECSSAAGEMESKVNREKISATSQPDWCKRARKDLSLKARDESTNPTMRNHRFTIGWISPLPLEKEAARLVMDEEYPQEEVQYDNVYYLGGRIGKHDVVIGVPTNMGLSNAAILAAKMSAWFPNIKYFLVVGIAGGVPHYGSAEIVLGDVVVSYPRRKHGGVIQYDKGAWKDSGHLHFHGHTNGIHHNLMAAINNFRAKGCFQNITQVLQQMRLKLDERRKNQYNDPGATCDSLFADTYEHQGTRFDDCKDCCDREHVISRAKRGIAAFRLPDSPFVHFGTIASSNQLQISVAERKRLQQEHEVLCFEMEAAGVMEAYPCMVIRGICDYADSHKNKNWQNYAAATAAAYAKGLLAEIPPMYSIVSP